MSKRLTAAVIFLVLGGISMFVQSTYYGYVDDSGVLHDSIFLPLAYIFGFAAACLLTISLVKYIQQKLQ